MLGLKELSFSPSSNMSLPLKLICFMMSHVQKKRGRPVTVNSMLYHLHCFFCYTKYHFITRPSSPSLSLSQDGIKSLRSISLYSFSLILPPSQEHPLHANTRLELRNVIICPLNLCQSSPLGFEEIHRICFSIVCF